jgi:hypothetical protein
MENPMRPSLLQRPLTRPSAVGLALLLASAPSLAVPAAFEVELRGVSETKKPKATRVDHSTVRMAFPLKPVAQKLKAPMPVMALLSAAGSGASQAAGSGEVVVEFRGMRFHPDHIVITEGVQIRMQNDTPVPLNLVPRGRPGKPITVAAGDSVRFAPGVSAVYRYGAQRWVSAQLRVDIAPKGQLAPMVWREGAHSLNLKGLKEGPARLQVLLGENWYSVPEFILRQNNTLKMVLSFEAAKKGEDKELQVRERREIPVEMNEEALMPTRKKRVRKKKRRKRRRKRRR